MEVVHANNRIKARKNDTRVKTMRAEYEKIIEDLKQRIEDLDRDNAILKANIYNKEMVISNKNEKEHEKWLLKYLALKKQAKEELQAAYITINANEREILRIQDELNKFHNSNDKIVCLLKEIESILNKFINQAQEGELKNEENTFVKSRNDLEETPRKLQGPALTARPWKKANFLLTQECIKDIFIAYDSNRSAGTGRNKSPNVSIPTGDTERMRDAKYISTYRPLLKNHFSPATPNNFPFIEELKLIIKKLKVCIDEIEGRVNPKTIFSLGNEDKIIHRKTKEKIPPAIVPSSSIYDYPSSILKYTIVIFMSFYC